MEGRGVGTEPANNPCGILDSNHGQLLVTYGQLVVVYSNLKAGRVAKERTRTGREVMKENRQISSGMCEKEDGSGRVIPLSGFIERFS